MGSENPDRGAVADKMDDPVAALRAAIEQLAAGDVAELIHEARAEARARVRARLTEAFTDSMVDQLHEQLSGREAFTDSMVDQLHGQPSGRRDPPVPQRPRSASHRNGSHTTDSHTTGSHGAANSASRVTASRAAPPERAVTSRGRPEDPPAGFDTEPDDRGPGELGWYAYGVVRAETADGFRLSGVHPGHPVTMVREGALAAVASQIPLEEFGESRLREHLEDMGWVEATARAHEAVLDEVQSRVTVIPMRMCTVYRNEDGVRELLRKESEPLLEALGHLEGKAEWGVKVFADSEGVPSAADDPREQIEPAGAAPGAAYMQRKRAERDAHERLEELLEEVSTQIHDRLAAVAFDGLLLPPQRSEATGRDDEMILNGVYLVLDEAGESFHAAVRELRSKFAPMGIELEPTGPWPAYNFVPGTIGSAW
jgi:hypothetical protein